MNNRFESRVPFELFHNAEVLHREGTVYLATIPKGFACTVETAIEVGKAFNKKGRCLTEKEAVTCALRAEGRV